MAFLPDLTRRVSNLVDPSSIDSLKSAISNHGGLAPQNRFGVIITPPTAAVLSYSNIISDAVQGKLSLGSVMTNSNDLSFFVESCQFPGKQINSFENSTVRNALKFPNGYVYEDVTMSFLVTNDYFVKELFDEWQNLIIDKTRYRAGYKDDYSSDITISQLDKSNVAVRTIKLKRAWPVGVNSIDFDNTAEGALVRVSVSFTFEEIIESDAIGNVIGKVKGFVSSIPKIPGIKF
tara:strand:+ start:9336 stop:10037 length:702 start_codon:yes stop_codon:yes gene_type:complete